MAHETFSESLYHPGVGDYPHPVPLQAGVRSTRVIQFSVE
jgi:hypothetical protein